MITRAKLVLLRIMLFVSNDRGSDARICAVHEEGGGQDFYLR